MAGFNNSNSINTPKMLYILPLLLYSFVFQKFFLMQRKTVLKFVQINLLNNEQTASTEWLKVKICLTINLSVFF